MYPTVQHQLELFLMTTILYPEQHLPPRGQAGLRLSHHSQRHPAAGWPMQQLGKGRSYSRTLVLLTWRKWSCTPHAAWPDSHVSRRRQQGMLPATSLLSQ